MMRRRQAGTIGRFVLASLFAFSPVHALAQTSLQIPLQFDFVNPGAKSLALGGAFAGLADDATATFANPAGLTQLNASELSIEARGTRMPTKFLQGGRLSGTVTNEGDDTVVGPVFGDSVGSHFGAGFLAGVYTHTSHRWVIAAYRHELVRVDQSFLSNGAFQKDPTELNNQRDFPQEGIRQVSITGYGAAGSYKISQTLAIGGSLTAYAFDMNSVFRKFATVGFFGSPNLNFQTGYASQSGNAVSWAPTLGVLAGRDQRRFGVVYRRGASFDMTTQTPAPPPAPDGTLQSRIGIFRVPDTLAFGASVRPMPALTLALEVTRLWYSRLREDFVTDQAVGSGRASSFSIDDGTEVHGGVQYAVPQWRGLPRFRAGAWFDPDHSVHFTRGAGATASDRLFDERLSTALSTGKNQVHATGGIGLTLGSHIEFNAAFDVASTTRIFSSSLILR
jgi:long-subunit fatty acid transport protein